MKREVKCGCEPWTTRAAPRKGAWERIGKNEFKSKFLCLVCNEVIYTRYTEEFQVTLRGIDIRATYKERLE